MSSTVDSTMQKWIAAGSSLNRNRVIHSHKDAPSVKDPFATYLLINAMEQGFPWHMPDNSAKLYSDWKASYSVQWFRNGSQLRAERFRQWAFSAEALQILSETGLSLNRMSGISNLEDLVEKGWEERRAIDVDIGYVAEFDRDRQTIAVPDMIARTPVVTVDGSAGPDYALTLGGEYDG